MMIKITIPLTAMSDKLFDSKISFSPPHTGGYIEEDVPIIVNSDSVISKKEMEQMCKEVKEESVYGTKSI